VSSWLKLIVFCVLWTAYTVFVLNFKEEFHGYLHGCLKRIS